MSCIRTVTLFVAAFCGPPLLAQSTTRISVDSAGLQGNLDSAAPSISADGRLIAFASSSDNLVQGDTNGCTDVFVHDFQTGITTRVSVNSTGVAANNHVAHPVISANGRHVAFSSFADNLVAGDTNGVVDVFIHDRQTGQTTRVSIDSAGVQGNAGSGTPSLSEDGRLVAFGSWSTNLVTSDTNGCYDVFLHDVLLAQTTLVSVGIAGALSNGDSQDPSISASGRFVAFHSRADNLVLGDTNGWNDVFVRDLLTGQSTRVSVSSSGAQSNFDDSVDSAISADGRSVAFMSYATNLVPGDTNGCSDVFVHDVATGVTQRVSKDSAGVQGRRYSQYPRISADGRYVSFFSKSNNLVLGDTNALGDIFVHDRLTGLTTRVSVDSAGLEGDGDSDDSSISGNGRYISFQSMARNLVPSDTNGQRDVFIHDYDPVGIQLLRTGTCPGLIQLNCAGATPGGLIAIVHGSAGTFIKTNDPCLGLTLQLAHPVLGVLLTADGSGMTQLSFNAPPGACGRRVLAIDVAACKPSNAIVL